MIIDKDGNVTIITQEKSTIPELIKKINLSVLRPVKLPDILEFLELSNKHRSNKLSFVVVTEQANHNEMPNEIVVVPTLHEANDIIEMEEIERDLGF